MANGNGFSIGWDEVRKFSITIFAIIILPWAVWITNRVLKYEASREILELKIKEWHNTQLKDDLKNIEDKFELIKKDLQEIKIEIASKK